MRSLALLGAFLLLSAAGADAATIHVSLTGTISRVYPMLASGPFAVGDPVRASFQIDSTTPDFLGSYPDRGVYVGAVSHLSLSLGGYEGTGTGQNELRVFDDGFRPPVDLFHVISEIAGDDVAGLPPKQLSFGLIDDTAALFSGDAVPTSLALADFDRAVLLVPFGTREVGTHWVGATVESLTYTIPEPGALLLVLALGAAIGSQLMRLRPVAIGDHRPQQALEVATGERALRQRPTAQTLRAATDATH